MPLVLLFLGILVLLFLIVRLKLSAFLGLLITSLLVAMASGLSGEQAIRAVNKGIGDSLGSLALILVFGAMLGKLVEESGAATTISNRLTGWFGPQRLQWSVVVTGFLVGLPMIYNASFLVLIPLIYALSTTARVPLMQLGIPLSAALSVTHGYLPPHPAPTSVAAMFGADVNVTLLYGLVLAVPATLLAGPVLATRFRHVLNGPPAALFDVTRPPRQDLPGLGISLATTLLPVVLMLVGAVSSLVEFPGGAAALPTIKFISEPSMALFLSVLVGFVTVGRRGGRSMDDLMKSMGGAAASVCMVFLVIAAGGAFKQVLLETGAGDYIKTVATRAELPPLLLAWGTAAVLRLALGSATVAAITAGGVILPLVHGCGVRPELLVLATTSGSLMFSHFNDIGFWMFKEYYNLTVRQTFQIWTVMETIVALVGLGGAFALHALLPA